MNRVFLFIIGIFFFTQTQAQLLNEIGISAGGSNYSGDIGREFFVFPNKLSGGLVYKRNVNSRMSLRGSYNYLPIFDHDKYAINKVRRERGYGFDNTIHEVSFGVEINYLEYDVLSDYNGATPYLFLEFAGFTYKTISAVNQFKRRYSFAVPFGAGYKSKITDFIGYSVEIKARYTFVDDLDYNNFTNTELFQYQFGNPNTNDWYFFTGASLTYSFGRPNCSVPRF